ncbi:SDR family NAD(P)-dependent oxidoreductase [Psychrobacter sp.]|uniref:SDR family NAD(P)-dependent oxidoreductase n=1 Tax=Psychrobacter sp. TaxID=56811 RepID=UPI0025DA846A|nr:SDR family NAD(P)-dependent oxidoreductase [Psychrobacter sp.]
MKNFYQNHVAAITGAGSGIGRGLALSLASAGCHLALSDINSENLAETQALLSDYDVQVTTTHLDVSDKDAVYQWAEQVAQSHGQVNFIFNNAGVALASTVEGESIEEIEWVMNINFWGMVYGTKAFLPLIKQSVKDSGGKQHGHIINISSLFGIIALPAQSAYNASKFAIRGFNESLRQELNIERSGVSITSVHPGGIKTNIANNARANESVSSLGIATGAKGLKNFNKLLKFDPTTAAQIILMAAANNQARCLIGDDAKIIDLIQRLFPSNYGQVMHRGSRLIAKAKKKAITKKVPSQYAK